MLLSLNRDFYIAKVKKKSYSSANGKGSVIDWCGKNQSFSVLVLHQLDGVMCVLQAGPKCNAKASIKRKLLNMKCSKFGTLKG